MIFKIPDVLSLLFMQFYRRIERLNDIILIYLPKFKALRYRNGICKLCLLIGFYGSADQQDFYSLVAEQLNIGHFADKITS